MQLILVHIWKIFFFWDFLKLCDFLTWIRIRSWLLTWIRIRIRIRSFRIHRYKIRGKNCSWPWSTYFFHKELRYISNLNLKKIGTVCHMRLILVHIWKKIFFLRFPKIMSLFCLDPDPDPGSTTDLDSDPDPYSIIPDPHPWYLHF